MANEEWVNLSSGGSPMRCLIQKPRAKPRGGVVLIHGGWGLDASVARLAKRLSLVDYTVVAPDMYHREKGEASKDVAERMARLTWAGAKADIAAAMDHLTAKEGVDAGKIAILGYCMGGAMAWMAGAELPCATVLLYYPHDMFKAFGTNGQVPFELTPRVPVLGHFGVEDTNPSPEDAKRLLAHLAEKKITHQFYHYQDAGHGFLGALPELYRQIPANTSIDRTVGWLDMHIKG